MEVAGIAADVVARVEREATDLLTQLIRIDTSNPPGNESLVAEALDAWFSAHGLHGEIVGEPAERRSFVLRLTGSRPGPRLALMAHEDVVPAEGEHWRQPPFDGVLKDGYIWGRGAVDVKNLLAAFAVTIARLAEEGADFSGEVVFVAEADEEDGAIGGARWLVENRPDLVKCDYLLNEGGGEWSPLDDGRRLYELHVGEKGTAQFRVTIHGDAGHASVPMRRGNAVVGAADVIRALHDYEPELRLDTVPRAYVELLVDDPELRARLLDEAAARAALAELGERDKRAADLLAPLYGLTFSPTIVHSSGEAVNVYPQQVVVSVDCRMPVGWTEDRVRAEIDRALAGVDARWELAFIGTVEGNASLEETPYREAITRVMGRLVPGAEVVPIHSVGFTDSNWFRAAFPDVVAYNFAPFLVDDGETVTTLFHNVDEKIAVADLTFQSLFAYELVRELLG
ncbi:MAG TPA: M20/M25/M40 family metallo-hydrolase [Thermoleophilia bacterium]|nr:M20/M25/M40 family metallo-hydrolase [Thermoleophilia bacterium]